MSDVVDALAVYDGTLYLAGRYQKAIGPDHVFFQVQGDAPRDVLAVNGGSKHQDIYVSGIDMTATPATALVGARIIDAQGTEPQAARQILATSDGLFLTGSSPTPLRMVGGDAFQPVLNDSAYVALLQLTADASPVLAWGTQAKGVGCNSGLAVAYQPGLGLWWGGSLSRGATLSVDLPPDNREHAFAFATCGANNPTTLTAQAFAFAIGAMDAQRITHILPTGDAPNPVVVVGNASTTKDCGALADPQGFVRKVAHPTVPSPWPEGCGVEPTLPLVCQ